MPEKTPLSWSYAATNALCSSGLPTMSLTPGSFDATRSMPTSHAFMKSGSARKSWRVCSTIGGTRIQASSTRPPREPMMAMASAMLLESVVRWSSQSATAPRYSETRTASMSSTNTCATVLNSHSRRNVMTVAARTGANLNFVAPIVTEPVVRGESAIKAVASRSLRLRSRRGPSLRRCCRRRAFWLRASRRGACPFSA